MGLRLTKRQLITLYRKEIYKKAYCLKLAYTRRHIKKEQKWLLASLKALFKTNEATKSNEKDSGGHVPN